MLARERSAKSVCQVCGVPRPFAAKNSTGCAAHTRAVEQGTPHPLKPKEVWKIRARLQLEGRERDLAMFTRADDSKFRAAISFDSKSTT